MLFLFFHYVDSYFMMFALCIGFYTYNERVLSYHNNNLSINTITMYVFALCIGENIDGLGKFEPDYFVILENGFAMLPDRINSLCCKSLSYK